MLYQQLIHQIGHFKEHPVDTPVFCAAQSDATEATVTLVDVDRLSCCIASLEIRALDASAVDVAETAYRLDAFLNHATYLTEPLAVVEKSDDLRHILVRSSKPQTTAEHISYYELTVLDGTTLRVQRLSYDLKARRRLVVPFTLSYDIFKRLVADLQAIFTDVEEHEVKLPSRFSELPSAWAERI